MQEKITCCLVNTIQLLSSELLHYFGPPISTFKTPQALSDNNKDIPRTLCYIQGLQLYIQSLQLSKEKVVSISQTLRGEMWQ